MTPAYYLAFMACVAVATYVQNMTGFAFSLILLSLVGVFHVAPIADAVNAATVLILVNAYAYFRLHRIEPQWRAMRPVLSGSLVGVAAGVVLLGWLSGNALHWLRALLGVSILGCALLLLMSARTRATRSGPASGAVVGMLSGLLGGLFSSSGPPLVYYMYQQPLPAAIIRESLLLVFAVNAVARLVLVVGAGQFSLYSAGLAACAIPVVLAVNRLHFHFPLKASPLLLRRLVAGLLLLAGTVLLATAMQAGAH